jgi:putative membrane protein
MSIQLLALLTTLLVAVAHVGFMVLETFLWTTPTGRRIFGQSEEDAATTAVLAKNQGVYNGALGVALAYAALAGQSSTALVLLAFVVVVGVYGALTAKGSILFMQALPAALAFTLTVLAR